MTPRDYPLTFRTEQRRKHYFPPPKRQPRFRRNYIIEIEIEL